MEVGNQGIDGLELISRIDVNAGIAAAAAESAVFLHDTLQRPAARCPDGDNSSAFRFRQIEALCHFFRHGVIFLMHDVIRDFFLF